MNRQPHTIDCLNSKTFAELFLAKPKVLLQTETWCYTSNLRGLRVDYRKVPFNEHSFVRPACVRLEDWEVVEHFGFDTMRNAERFLMGLADARKKQGWEVTRVSGSILRFDYFEK